MKTVPLVMMLLLLPLFAHAADAAGGDREVTVVGTDEALMALPDPWTPDLVDTPRPDTVLIEAPAEPLILPPESLEPPQSPVAGQTPEAAQ